MDKPCERRNLIQVTSAIGLITESVMKAIDYEPVEGDNGTDPTRQLIADTAAATINSGITLEIGGQ